MGRFRNRPHAMTAVAGLAFVMVAVLAPPPSLGQSLTTYTEKLEPGDRSPAPFPVIAGPHDVHHPGYDTAPKLRVDIGTNVLLEHEARFYGVTAIAIQETGDEPCKVEIYGRILDPNFSSKDVILGTGRLTDCDPGRTDSWRAATVVGRRQEFIREAQMCHPLGATPWHHPIKLKGLSVSTAFIDADGDMRALPMQPCVDRETPHCFARPHCKIWGLPAGCPAGQIVTGVTMYHFAENNRPPQAFYAIGLHCQGVRHR
jgi:hypothetical protein